MKRSDFLKLPMDERRHILAAQANKLAEAGYPFEEWPEVSEPPTIEKMKAELGQAGAGRDAEALLKEAVAILDDFQGYYCAEDSCPIVDEAYRNAAAFVAKIRETK